MSVLYILQSCSSLWEAVTIQFLVVVFFISRSTWRGHSAAQCFVLLLHSDNSLSLSPAFFPSRVFSIVGMQVSSHSPKTCIWGSLVTLNLNGCVSLCLFCDGDPTAIRDSAPAPMTLSGKTSDRRWVDESVNIEISRTRQRRQKVITETHLRVMSECYFWSFDSRFAEMYSAILYDRGVWCFATAYFRGLPPELNRICDSYPFLHLTFLTMIPSCSPKHGLLYILTGCNCTVGFVPPHKNTVLKCLGRKSKFFSLWLNLSHSKQ